ncbi:MAG TPA: hypothetical protein VNZ64_18315 [Candidatus Acidoferrum sp.]|jgi:hypothetical protein|nr:hypothetical protein [Candidatus Acidoferrum sp.]
MGPPAGFLPLARARVLNHGPTPPPGLTHRPGWFPVIHRHIPLILNHRVTERSIRQLRPVDRSARRLQQKHRRIRQQKGNTLDSDYKIMRHQIDRTKD